MTVVRAPAGLRRSGRGLWHAVTGEHELSERERQLLRQAALTADLIDDLSARLAQGDLMSTTSQGPRVNPLVVELRQQRITLARLLAALRITDDDTRTTGPRGVYTMR